MWVSWATLWVSLCPPWTLGQRPWAWVSLCGPETLQLLTCHPDAWQSPSLPLGLPLVAPGLGAWAQLGNSRLLGGSCKQGTRQDHAQPFLLSLYSSFHTHPCLCSSTLTPTLHLSPLIPAYSPLLHSPLPFVTPHSPLPPSPPHSPFPAYSPVSTYPCSEILQALPSPLTPARTFLSLPPPLTALLHSPLQLKLSPCPSWEEVRRQGWGARGQKGPRAWQEVL